MARESISFRNDPHCVSTFAATNMIAMPFSLVKVCSVAIRAIRKRDHHVAFEYTARAISITAGLVYTTLKVIVIATMFFLHIHLTAYCLPLIVLGVVFIALETALESHRAIHAFRFREIIKQQENPLNWIQEQLASHAPPVFLRRLPAKMTKMSKCPISNKRVVNDIKRYTSKTIKVHLIGLAAIAFGALSFAALLAPISMVVPIVIGTVASTLEYIRYLSVDAFLKHDDDKWHFKEALTNMIPKRIRRFKSR